MSKTLLNNLHLIADSKDGIKKIRQLILDLAVRGKLVPQDPNDEPASELLKKIQAEKQKLIAEGKIKKEKPLQPITDSEKPFDLPNGWEWVRLGELGETNIGLTYSPANISESGVPVLRSSNIQSGKLDLSDLVRVNMTIKTGAMVQEGDLLICARNGSKALVGKTALLKNLPEKMAFGAFMAIYRSKINNFVEVFLNSPVFRSKLEGVSTTTINQITQNNLKNTTISLPPLNEQVRIVAYVDELMKICDHLEKQKNISESSHKKLLQTCLQALTNSQSHDEFVRKWKRIEQNFETLFTTEESVDELKKTILQLAVMGKLVPHDPSDEPASELLKKIQTEKQKLIAAGKIKKEKPLPPITDSEKLFELPKGWVWEKIGNFVLQTDYGTSEKSYNAADGVPVLGMGHIQDGRVLLENCKKIKSNTEGLPDLFLKNNDLLYNRTNSAELVGKTGIYLGENDTFTFASYLIRLSPSKSSSPAYLNTVMNTWMFRETQIVPHLKQQCGQANVNGTILKNMIIQIPPLNEQIRIVACVDELMKICDTLKSQIFQSQIILNKIPVNFN